MEEFKELQNPIDLERAEFWKDYIESYDRVLSNIEGYKQLQDMHAQSFSDKSIILDSCAGTGRTSLELLKQNKKVVAIDQNESGLEMLKKNAGELNSNLTTYCCDANHLPIENDSVDGASSMLAISFMRNPEQYLRENFRVLAPDGIFVISGPSEEAKDFTNIGYEWLNELIQKDLFEELRSDWRKVLAKTNENIGKHVFNWFSVEKMKELLERVGFKVLETHKNPLYYGRGYVVKAIKPKKE